MIERSKPTPLTMQALSLAGRGAQFIWCDEIVTLSGLYPDENRVNVTNGAGETFAVSPRELARAQGGAA